MVYENLKIIGIKTISTTMNFHELSNNHWKCRYDCIRHFPRFLKFTPRHATFHQHKSLYIVASFAPLSGYCLKIFISLKSPLTLHHKSLFRTSCRSIWKFQWRNISLPTNSVPLESRPLPEKLGILL